MKNKLEISSISFGTLPDGRETTLFTLSNKNGIRVNITNYGGIIQSIKVPDRKGGWVDIVAGYDTLEEYLHDGAYFGAIVGRYANRIAKGIFTIDKQAYQLATNNGKHHLHGGKQGLNRKLWNYSTDETEKECSLILTCSSPDGEENYPGKLDIAVVYSLTDQDELMMQYYAETTKPTFVNLTNHSYFNVKGSGKIDDTLVVINAGHFTETDDELIPSGKLKSVEGTALDFRKAKPIAANIAETGVGYDHNFVLNKKENEISFAAKASEPSSGRSIEVYTTQPAMQFYTGNFLRGIKGKNGRIYQNHEAFCFETQHFPDSPNRPEFPSTLLKPGEIFDEKTIIRFVY